MMIFLKVIVLLIGLCVSPRPHSGRAYSDAFGKPWGPMVSFYERISLKSVEGENPKEKSERKKKWEKVFGGSAKSEEADFCEHLEYWRLLFLNILRLEHVYRYSLDDTMPVQPNIEFDNANLGSITKLKQYVKRNAEDVAWLETMRFRDMNKIAGVVKRALQFGGLDHTSLQIFTAFDELVVVNPYEKDDPSSAPKIPPNDCLRDSIFVKHTEARGGPKEYLEALKRSIKEGTKFDLVTITGPYPLATAMIILAYITQDTIIKVKANIAREELSHLRKHYIIKSNVEDEDFPMRQERAMVMQLKSVYDEEEKESYKKFIDSESDEWDIKEAERSMKEFKRTLEGTSWEKDNELNLLWQVCESNILGHTHEFISLVKASLKLHTKEGFHQVKDFCKKRELGVVGLLKDKGMKKFVQTLKSEITRSTEPLLREHPLFNIVSGFQNTVPSMSRNAQKVFVGGRSISSDREKQLVKDIEYCKKTKNYTECLTQVLSLLYADLIKFVHLEDLDE